MDGLPSAPALPPVGGPPAPAYAGSALPTQPAFPPQRQPPGRPALDPEVQEAKVRTNAEVKRLERMLPKQVDSKLQIFQMRKGQAHLQAQQKPVIVMTASEMEAEISQGTAADDVIAAAIAQKGFNGGRFLCRYIDRNGRIIPQIPMWEVGDDAADGQDAVNANDETPLSDAELDALLQGGTGYSPFPAQPAPLPPQPAAVDASTVARVARDERNDERGRGLELVQVVSAQSNTLLTVMMKMSADQQAQAERARQDEAARRANTLQTIMTLIPLILPIVQGMFKRDAVAAPTESPTDRMMVELLRAKLTEKPENNPLDKMMEMLLLTSKAQMELQSTGARSVVESQAAMQGAMMKNMIEMVKEFKPGSGDKDDGLEKYIPLLAPFAEKFLAGQQAAAPAAPPLPAPAPRPAQAAVRRRPQPGTPAPGAATPPASAAPPPARRPLPPHRVNTRRQAEQMTPEQRIGSCLVTIQGLSTGQIPATQRLQAMHYIIDTATPELLAAIDTGDQRAVVAVGQAVVLATPALLQWVAAEHHQSFLTEVCADIRLLRMGQMTRERLDVGIRTTAQFTAQYHDHIQQLPAPTPRPPAPVMPAGPVTPNGPPVAALITDPPPEQPKRPPPSDNGMIGGTAEPAASPPSAPGGATLSGPPPIGEAVMPVPGAQAAPPPDPAASPRGRRRPPPPPPAAGANGATSPRRPRRPGRLRPCPRRRPNRGDRCRG